MRAPRSVICCQNLVPTGNTQLLGSLVSIFAPGGSQTHSVDAAPSAQSVAPGWYRRTSGATVRVVQFV